VGSKVDLSFMLCLLIHSLFHPIFLAFSAVLFKDSRLADVAVTGIQDPKDGAEKPWAFLVAHDSVFKNVDESEKESRKEEVGKSIVEKANSQMAGYKKIEGMTWIDGLPKRYVDKVASV
jgi:4-coumarate--CoA ligase